MQATEADIENLKNRGYEDSINFRPSPNFKHMKKYLKSKFEEAVYNSSSSGEQTSCSSAEEEERSNPPTVMLQPLLERSNPPTVMVQQSLERSNPATVMVQTPLERSNPGLVMVQPPLERSSGPTVMVQQPLERNNAPAAMVPPQLEMSNVPTVMEQQPLERSNPSTAMVQQPLERSNPSTVTVQQPLERSNPSAVTMQPSLERSNAPTVMLQPPLPPNPPPPGSPLKITLKKEIEDDEYQSNAEEQRAQSEEVMSEYGAGAPESTDDKSKIMCRQFVRGTCTRGAACIYRHELILDQLPGVYTFCKNFQNNGCNYPKCKFVHATVFEKEGFYRTGSLPAHTVAHLKENNAQHPQPPLHATEGSVEVPSSFPNPPPPIIYPRSIGGAAGSGGVAAGRKRDWASSVPFGASVSAAASASAPASAAASSLALELCEPPSKKCRDCDITEFRYQCNKSKVEQLLRSTQETKTKLSALTRKNNQLYSIIGSLMNTNPGKAGPAAIFNNMNIRNDKEKDIVDKLNMYLSGSRHLSPAEDKNMSLSTVLVRLLLGSRDGAPSS